MMQHSCNKLADVGDPLRQRSSAGVLQHFVREWASVCGARLSWKLISSPCEGATLGK